MAEAGKWSDYYITEKGRALRQRCIAEKKTVAFVRASIGTGRPASTSVIDTMENLVSFNKIVQHYKSYAMNTNHFAVVRVDNTDYTQDILMSEVGIFAKEKDELDSAAILYGYAYNLSSYVLIPEYANGNNHKVYEITFDTALSQSTSVELIYDGSPIYATHQDLDDAFTTHNTDPAAHPSILEELDNKADKNTTIKRNLPLSDKLKHYFDCYYAKDDSGGVTLIISTQVKSNDELLLSGESIGVLPVGFRPKTTIEVQCTVGLDDLFNRRAGSLIIGDNGYISAYSDNKTPMSIVFASCYFSSLDYL